MLNKIIKYSHRSKLLSCQVLAALFAGLLVAPTPSLAQGSGAMTAKLQIADQLDFGVWSGADIIQGNLIPNINDVFCIIYETQFIGPRLLRVNYELELRQTTGTPLNNGYVLEGSGGNLPVSFLLSPAAGSTVSISGSPENGLNPADGWYDVTFPDPATNTSELSEIAKVAPGGCNDARFDFEVSVDFADIIALSNPTGTYESTFTIAARAPTFIWWLGFLGGRTDLIDFTVSITIESSVYIDQLSNAIDLNSQTQEDFCVWSFDGSAVTLTASSDNPGSFTLENQDSLGATVDSIPYTLELQSLYNNDLSTLTNGAPQMLDETESAASDGVSCNGPQGLNYRLNFNVSDSSGKAAGDYTDRITLTVAPN